MLALLDGDIFAYRAAASAEKETAEVAVWRAQDSIDRCLNDVGATTFVIWLSDKAENNFRYSIYPEYKANRTQLPPTYLPNVLNALKNKLNAKVTPNQEADDALGIDQCNLEEETIICSIDKDLLQIPGLHYNFVKQEFKTVTKEEGIKHFYKQFLIGDRADNIFGVYGIGPKKADGIINPCTTEEEMFDRVVHYYENDRDRAVINGKVLWIRQKQEQIWEPPIV